MTLVVDRYRITVGRYRRNVLTLESTRPGLFRTPKNLKIDPIATENGKNRNRLIFFGQKYAIKTIALARSIAI